MILIEPADCAVRFQMRMLDPRRDVGGLMNDVGIGETGLDVADMAMDFRHDIALRLFNASLRALVVNNRR